MKSEVTIDSITDSIAVLTTGTLVFELPVALLPRNAREGDVLQLAIEQDPKATRKARRSIAAKLRKLSADDDGGDFSL